MINYDDKTGSQGQAIEDKFSNSFSENCKITLGHSNYYASPSKGFELEYQSVCMHVQERRYINVNKTA